MKKGILSTTSDIVNGIWNAGTEVYKVVADEVSDAAKEEALRRTRKHFEGQNIDERSEAFARVYFQHKSEVEKEFKGMAVKGGLMALGLGLFF